MIPAATQPPAHADVLRFFRILGDETRLSIIRMLSAGDLRAGELGAALRLPSNALAYHLKQLQSLRLLRDRRSGADARDVYYHLDLDCLHHLFAETGNALYPGLGAASGNLVVDDFGSVREVTSVTARPLRVLFLCTHNSARSQISEALMRHMGGERVEVYSAGSMPTEVHPDTFTVLRELGVDASGLHAKSLDQFVGEQMDYTITVCDRMRDICPAFIGDPNQIHWSFPDPLLIEEPEQRLNAFRQIAIELRTRIGYLLLLPHRQMSQPLHSFG